MNRAMTWVTGFCLLFVYAIAMPSKLNAWHGCHSSGHSGFAHSGLGHWGGYGMGGGVHHAGFGGYGAYSWNSGYFPSRSYCAPGFAAYYPWCLSYGVNFVSPFYGPYYGGSFYSSFPSFYYPVFYSTNYCAPPVVHRPVVVSWLASAIEMIDLMVEQGGVEEGLQACEQLIRVRDQLPSEIYWRAAALAAVSNRPSAVIIAFVESAEKSGERFSSNQLPGGSLRAYLRTAKSGSLDAALNRLALAAMSSERPQSEYQALAAVLALDGQTDRARVFLAAAIKAAPSSSSLAIASLATLER